MADQPNILFILTDEQKKSALGCYGNSDIDTPNIDALAEDSLVFENAYCSQPNCNPSRASIWTGLYPHTTGVTSNSRYLPSSRSATPHITCLPEYECFDDYTTAHFGDKWDINDTRIRVAFDETDIDFDYSDHYPQYGSMDIPEEEMPDVIGTRRARQFIEHHQNDPFFLAADFRAPHGPFTSPRDDQYDPDDVSLPPNFEDGDSEDQPLRLRLRQGYFRHFGSLIENAYPDLNLPIKSILGDPPTEEEWKELISNYWGRVSLIDRCVGDVLEKLEECNLEDDTVVVFTSDHGDMMGSHRTAWKDVMYQEAINIPLILSLPEFGGNGTRVKNPVSQVDIVPTLLDAVGCPIPEHLHGGSWLPFLSGEGELEHEDVIVMRGGSANFAPLTGSEPGSSYSESQPVDPEFMEKWEGEADEQEIIEAVMDPIRTIITPDGWKFNFRTTGEHELYDLDDDPHELRNVAGDPEHADLIEELAERIHDWQVRTGDPVHLSGHPSVVNAIQPDTNQPP